MNPWIWQHPQWPQLTWQDAKLAAPLAAAHAAIGRARATLAWLTPAPPARRRRP